MKKFLSILTLGAFLASAPFTLAGACEGEACLQTSYSEAVAAPEFWNGSNAWGFGNVQGGWKAGGEGLVGADAYGQGTKKAESFAIAGGEATGEGFAVGIATRNFGYGASAAKGTISVGGAALAGGVDNWSRYNNPDYANARVGYMGFTAQSNGIVIDNNRGTFVGGGNSTETGFDGWSSDKSYGTWWCFDKGIPAVAGAADGAEGVAQGFTLADYETGRGYSKASGITVGMSEHNGDHGYVAGNGAIQHGTFAAGPTGSYGYTNGVSTFCYEGGNFGAGVASTQGAVFVNNDYRSSSVLAISKGEASATSNGGWDQAPR